LALAAVFVFRVARFLFNLKLGFYLHETKVVFGELVKFLYVAQESLLLEFVDGHTVIDFYLSFLPFTPFPL
jgi:hypothetical protein